jgi:C4-dicarboxylate-specific signal transduction histidine kinase
MKYLSHPLAIIPGILYPALVQADSADNSGSDLLILTGGLLLIFLIISLYLLQRSRLSYKSTKLKLDKIRHNLELRVVERTDKLRTLNTKLFDEIGRHEQTELQLRATQSYLNKLIDSMPSAIIGINAEGIISHWNSNAEQLCTMPSRQALGKQLFGLIEQFPVSQDDINAALEKAQPISIETIKWRAPGQDKPAFFDISIYPLDTASNTPFNRQQKGCVIRLDDVTPKVELESQLIHNEKMFSMAEMAAGLAHEINNPLTAIVQGAQNIQRRLSKELVANNELAEKLDCNIDTLRSYLEQRGILRFVDNIEEAGERAANIIATMLKFSHTGHSEQRPTDLRELLEQSLLLAGSSYCFNQLKFSDILLERQLPEEPLVLHCSAIEIQQVILNILRNANQALSSPAVQTPTISITLQKQDQDIVLTIADNGPGMDQDATKRLFDPFFTTKEVGEGTGLGLSVSYFIITKHHQGSIEVNSQPGQGAKFTIHLPC